MDNKLYLAVVPLALISAVNMAEVPATDAVDFDIDLCAKVVLGQMVMLWSSATFLLAGAKEVNSIRDRVVVGSIDRAPITATFRRHIVKNDWVPILICVVFTSLAYAWLTGFIALKLYLGAEPWYSSLYWAMCAFYCAITLSWALTARADYMLMINAIARDELARDKASPSSDPDVPLPQ